MADLKTTVELIFEGVDNASTRIDGIAGSLGRLEGKVTSVTAPLASLAKGILAVETAAAATAIALGVTAYNASVKYESAVADLDKVLGASGDELATFIGQIKEVAKQYGVGANEAIASAADWIKANKSTGESLKLVALSIETAIAAEVDQATATENLKRLTEVYGLSADELRTKLDFLNTVSDNNAVTAGQLLEAMQGAAAAANEAGFSFEELVARLTPGVARMQESSEVGRAMRTTLANLVDPTDKQTQALENLGISLTKANGDTKNSKELFDELAFALQGTDDNTKAMTLAIIGGADQFARLSAIMAGTETSAKILNGEFQRTTTLAGETERILGTSTKVLDAFKNSITATSVAAGNELNPAIDGIVQALTALFGELAGAIEAGALDEFFEGLSVRFGDLQEAILEVARNLPQALSGLDFSGLLDSLDNVGDAILGIFEIDISSPEGLRNAIQSIIDAFAGLNNLTAGIIGGLEPVIDAFQALANGVGSANPEITAAVGNILGLATSLNTLLPIMTSAVGIIAAVLGAKGLAGLAPLAITAANGVGTLVAALGGSTGLVAILGAFSFEITRLSGLDQTLNDLLVPDWLAGYENASLGSAIADVVDGFASLVTAAPPAEKSLDSVSKSAQSLVDDGLGGFSEELNALLSDQEAWAKSLSDTDDVINKSVIGYYGIAEATKQAATAQAELVVSQDELSKNSIILAETGLTIAETFQKQSEDANKLSLAQQGLAPITQEIIDLWRGGPIIVDKLSNSSKSLAEQLDDAAASGEVAKDKIFELQIELEKAQLEAKVEFDIAQLEADTERAKAQFGAITELAQIQATVDVAEIEAATERIKASFETINSIFETTGSSIDNLVDAIAGVSDADKYAREKIEAFTDALDRQLTIQETMTDSAVRLNDAQIKELQARADRLRSGDAVITIDGGTLQPHLEAFMFEILSAIQVRANADASAFLLGI
jgi:TP901 family phage tail tape measure protein